MNDRVPFLIYKRLSNDWSRHEKPIRLHQFSRTPLLDLGKDLKRRSVDLKIRGKHRKNHGSLDKYSIVATQIGLHENRARKGKEKITVLPPIRFLRKEAEESEDEGLSLKDFLKQWKYIE
jgi:hypothetical protein